MISALAEARYDQFLAGLLIGIFLGLVLGPLLRSWLAWREWAEASREANLTDRLLQRLEASRPAEGAEPPASDGSTGGLRSGQTIPADRFGMEPRTGTQDSLPG